MASKVIMIRHGVTEANLEWRFIGSTDLPLADKGREQARRLRGLVKNIAPRVALCSPLKRARETAEIVAREAGFEIVIEPDLREIDFGGWENMKFDEIREKYRADADRWLAGHVDIDFPGGERMDDFLERVRRVNRKMAEYGDETVVAFTHAGVIGQSICQLLDLPPDRHTSFKLPPTSITTIEMFEGRGLLRGICAPECFDGGA